MTELVEQQTYIKFCITLEHSSAEAIQMIQKATAMATGDWQLHHNNVLTYALPLMQSFLAKDQTTQMTHPPYISDLVPWLLAFPKTKITFEREKISDHWWDSGKYDGAADGNWENCVRSQGAYFEEDWDVIVLCTIFLVSCVFFNKCLYF